MMGALLTAGHQSLHLGASFAMIWFQPAFPWLALTAKTVSAQHCPPPEMQLGMPAHKSRNLCPGLNLCDVGAQT